MRAWFTMVVLLSVALSGCAGEAEDYTPFEPTDSVDGDGTNETITNETAVNETVENLVPVLNVTMDVVNGTAPLLVNFTVAVEDDSENLSWVFFVEGNETLNGTEFPAMFNHTFEEGLWNITVQVADGEHVVSHEDAIEVLAGVTEPAFEQVVLSQAILLACPNCWAGPDSGGSACVGLNAGMNGVDCAFWDVDPAWYGQPYTIGGLFLPSGIFWEDCSGTGYIQWDFADSGVIPEGAGCLVVSDIVDPVVTAVVTIG